MINKKKRFTRYTLMYLFLFWYMIGSVYADELKWYKDNAQILTNNSIVEDAMRWIAWAITKAVAYLADLSETLYNKTFGFIDITNYESINSLVVKFKPVLIAVVVICVIAYGTMLIITKEKKPMVSSIILGVLVISSSTLFFITANQLSKDFKDGVLESNVASQSYQVVDNNLIDLINIDKKGKINSLNYKDGTGIIHNNGISSSSDMEKIDIYETLNWDDEDEGKDIYSWSNDFNKLITYRMTSVNTEYHKVKVYDGIVGSFANDFYYRYDFDFWSANLQLLALIILFISLSYKNVRIAYELVVSKFMAMMLVGDIGGGQKLKQALIFIRDTYITLLISVLCVKLYVLFTEAISSFGITGLAKGIVSLFIAYAVIDGPNLVERMLGMDAGLSSSVGRTMAMFGIARGISSAGAGAMKGAVSGGYKASRTFASGTTASQRAVAKGNPTMSEKFAQMFKSKSDDKKNNTSKQTSGSKDSSTYNASGYKDAQAGTESAKTREYDTSFMEGSDNNSGRYTQEDLSDGSKYSSKSSSSARDNYTSKSFNPQFRDAIRELAPDKNASKGEKRDFNRQVNSIVRGNHKAIAPSPNARAEYKQRNYEKALKLEKAYHLKKKK